MADAGLLFGMGFLTFGVTGAVAAALAQFVFRPAWEREARHQLQASAREEVERAERQSSQLEQELEHVRQAFVDEQTTLAQTRAQLGEYRRANVEWTRKANVYKARLTEKNSELERLSEMVIGLREEKPIIRRHTVFLDGRSGCGKSTFILRITKLTASDMELGKLMATVQPKLSEPIFLQSESTDEGLVFHVIRFYDIAGENGAGLLDVIETYGRQKQAGELVDGEQLGNAIGLVVWDTSAGSNAKGENRNQEHLAAARMQMAYGPRFVRDVVERVMVFLNKCDKLEAQLGQGVTPEQVGKVLAQQMELIRDQVFEYVPDAYRNNLTFTRGSALDGTGVHTCLGELIHALGLSYLYGDPSEEDEDELAVTRLQPIPLSKDDPTSSQSGPRRLTFTQTG